MEISDSVITESEPERFLEDDTFSMKTRRYGASVHLTALNAEVGVRVSRVYPEIIILKRGQVAHLG